MTAVRNRIVRHARVRAGDLVPHELNPRTHPPQQRAALAALYREIGFARSLLAYELPDGRLKLIDGHLRATMDPEQPVEVEVLDVNDREARALLLAIDPLAQLAGHDLETLGELRRLAEQDSQAVRDLWRVLSRAEQQTRDSLAKHRGRAAADEQFLIIIECSGEAQQVELLTRFQGEGLRCQAKVG